MFVRGRVLSGWCDTLISMTAPTSTLFTFRQIPVIAELCASRGAMRSSVTKGVERC